MFPSFPSHGGKSSPSRGARRAVTGATKSEHPWEDSLPLISWARSPGLWALKTSDTQ